MIWICFLKQGSSNNSDGNKQSAYTALHHWKEVSHILFHFIDIQPQKQVWYHQPYFPNDETDVKIRLKAET